MINELLKNVRLSDYDGKPIKNKLPAELKERFLTQNQWLELGMQIKDGATPIEMHPNAMHKMLCNYYFDTDVEPFNTSEELCCNCNFRNNKTGYCNLRLEFKSPTARCSEWDEKTV